MMASSYGTILQHSVSPDTNPDALQQHFPQSGLGEKYAFRRPDTGNFGLFTPQATQLLATDTQRLPVCEAQETPMSHNLAASVEAQNFFIRTTSILKAGFLKTPTPSVVDIHQLAAQTGLDQYGVSTWFDIIRNLKEIEGANVLPTPEVTEAILPRRLDFNVSENSPPPPVDSNVLRTTDLRARPSQTKAATRLRRSSSGKSRPSKRQRKGQSLQSRCSTLTLKGQPKVSRRRPSQTLGHEQYCCPTCKFQTGEMDQWYTHQTRNHFPSEVFICGINPGMKPCNKGPNSPCKRKDNFVTHLRNSHGYQSGEVLEEEISKRAVKVTGLFHDKCGFCSKTLDTREKSMKHIGGHIQSGDNVHNWTHQCTSLDHKLEPHMYFKSFVDELDPQDDSSDDDEDDEDDDDGSNDEDDTAQGNFDDWTQGGEYDAGDDWNDFDENLDHDHDRGTSFGRGGDFLPTNFMTAPKSVVNHREGILERIRSPDSLGQSCKPSVPLQSLVVKRTLGQGGSGAVLEVLHSSSQQSFAFKIIARTASTSRASQYRAFINEVRVMATLQHPHIVELFGFNIHPDSFSLLTAPVADTDLSKFLRMKASPRSSRVLMNGMSSLAAALDYIHSSPVLGTHNDIKPANILIKDSNFLIADFGISKFRSLGETPTADVVQVTPEYAAPETIRSLKQTPACDIWSLGCVYIEIISWILFGDLLAFAEFRRTDLGDRSFHKNLRKTNEWIRMLKKQQRRKTLWDQNRPIPLDTIREMLSEDPKYRPTAHDIWLRLPRCLCCSDWQATKYGHTFNQHRIDNKALWPTSTAFMSGKSLANPTSKWTPAKSPLISDWLSAVPDEPTSRIERGSNEWRHKLDADPISTYP